MNREERDSLEVRRVEALEGVAAELATSNRARRQRENRRRQEELHSMVGVKLPVNLFAGERGQEMLMRTLPRYVSLWERQVPPEHLSAVCDARTRQEWPVVLCSCGLTTSLELYAPRDCKCGRWFLALSTENVRIYRPAEA